MSEETKKKYPFEIDEYYSVGLNSLKRIYTQHPKFNGNVRLIYELLLDHWNAEFGYAFPDQWELAIESGISVSTVGRSIKVLKDLELITVRRSPIGKNNNVYYINKPINNIEEFYRKFPEIEEEARKRIAEIEADKQASMDKWKDDEKKGKPHTKKRTFYIPPKAEKQPKKEEGSEKKGADFRELEEWL